MDPEVSAILGVYQKRLNDVTQQAIAYEARIQVLQMQIQQIQQMQAQPPAPAAEPAKAPSRSRKKSAEATDAGSF